MHTIFKKRKRERKTESHIDDMTHVSLVRFETTTPGVHSLLQSDPVSQLVDQTNDCLVVISSTTVGALLPPTG